MVDQQAQSRVLAPLPRTMLIMADLGGGEWGGEEHLLCQVKVRRRGGSFERAFNGCQFRWGQRAFPLICRCALGVWSVSLLTCPKGQSGTVWRVCVEVSVCVCVCVCVRACVCVVRGECARVCMWIVEDSVWHTNVDAVEVHS